MRDRPVIKVILFDIDDTLLNFGAAERSALRQTLTRFGVDPTDGIIRRYSEINAACWRRLESGELTHSEVKTERYRLLFEENGIDASPSEVTKYYESKIPFEHATVVGAGEILEYLSPKYTLIAASNGTGATQRKRMADAGFDKYFTDIFISSELGVTKPEKEFFDAIFRKYHDIKREEYAIVGDSLTSDVTGGKNAGITTVWYDKKGAAGPPDPVPDHVVRSLEELKTLF